MNREFNRGSLVNKYTSESVNHKQGLDYNCSPGHSLISSHRPVDQLLTVSNTTTHVFQQEDASTTRTCTNKFKHAHLHDLTQNHLSC